MNNNQDSQKPIIPFKPQIENNQEELIAKAEEIIAPKKPKVKIILTTLVAFLLLGSIASAVFLVRQNQDVRKEAAGECGDRSLGECWGECRGVDEGEVCCTGPSQWSSWRLTTANSPSCGGTGNPTPTTPPAGGCDGTDAACTKDDTCCSKVCSFGKCAGGCSSFGEPECWTHANCHWESGSCKDGATPSAGAGNCKIDCGADEGGVSVTAHSGSETACAGATVTAVYYSKSCNGSSGGCAGQTTTQTGGLPFSANRTGPACGSWQSDINASTSKGGTCQTAGHGLLPCATPTTPPTLSCSCDLIKAYNPTWTLLTSTDLSALKAGDKIRFAAKGTTSSGTIDKIRYKINNGAYLESTIKKPGTNEFYYEYTIPANTTSFSVSAEVHQKETDKWFD